MDDAAFNAFCQQVEPGSSTSSSNSVITFENSSGMQFNVTEGQLRSMLARWRDRNGAIEATIRANPHFDGSDPWRYKEKPYRAAFATHFNVSDYPVVNSHGRSQTKSFVAAINMYVGFLLNNTSCTINDRLLLDANSLSQALSKPEVPPTAPPEQEGPVPAGDPVAVLEVADAFRAVCEFCENYNQRSFLTTSSKEADRLTASLEVLERWLIARYSQFDGSNFDVKFSRGSGKVPRVPWLVILPEGQHVNDGIYVGLCFGREGAGAVAGCAQSVTNPRPSFPATLRSLQKPLAIDVNGGTSRTRYNDAFANPLEVLKEAFDETVLEQHLTASLRLARELIAGPDQTSADPEELDQRSVLLADEFQAALEVTGFRTDPEITRTFIAALAAKPFVILTGNSGTGKTRLAILLAQWLHGEASDRYAVVPVGADWTDTRRVVGFLNPLRRINAADGANVYEQTQVLELLLRALEDPHRPYFLILDEMNLSHVERYFSDFLSAMESQEAIPLHGEEDLVLTADGQIVPSAVRVPHNLFIIGTVNVDETTYMFSPKVLDRANVIEFRTAGAVLGEFLQSGAPALAPVKEAAPLSAEAFLRISERARAGLDYFDTPTEQQLVHRSLSDIFELLAMSGFEFAFRTIHEIARYLGVDKTFIGGSGLEAALDRQILQKLLPRIHGTRRKLEPTLLALLAYAEGADLDGSIAAGKTGEIPQAGAVKFPRSAEKLRRMVDVIRRDQFASFIC